MYEFDPIYGTPGGLAVEDEESPLAYVSSYKCEDCGKIIAAPGDLPAPVCCENPMRKIR